MQTYTESHRWEEADKGKRDEEENRRKDCQQNQKAGQGTRKTARHEKRHECKG